jgi:hypothetical protein
MESFRSRGAPPPVVAGAGAGAAAILSKLLDTRGGTNERDISRNVHEEQSCVDILLRPAVGGASLELCNGFFLQSTFSGGIGAARWRGLRHRGVRRGH